MFLIMSFRKLVHIASILFIAILVASCAKDELEAPSDGNVEIQASDSGVQNSQDGVSIHALEVQELEDGHPSDGVAINDDDDEEDEDRNPVE